MSNTSELEFLKDTGILLVNKPKGRTSFSLIAALRRISGIQKIGHAGTLDPFATGVMILLVGKAYTRLSDQFLNLDKEYLATVKLGVTTDSYDCDGKVIATSVIEPSLEEILKAIAQFQGKISQIPPMFSAKKIKGKKLYELARKGIQIARAPIEIDVAITFISYEYPFLKINVSCSKGTYVRSLAHDLGIALGCGAHLSELLRLRSGNYRIENCVDGSLLDKPDFNFREFLQKQISPA